MQLLVAKLYSCVFVSFRFYYDAKFSIFCQMMLSDDECIGESSAPRESQMNTSISSNASSSGMSASTNWTSPSPIDKLRTIKPFEEKQLLNFYSNSLLDSNEQLVEAFVQVGFVMNILFGSCNKITDTCFHFKNRDTFRRIEMNITIQLSVWRDVWNVSRKQTQVSLN